MNQLTVKPRSKDLTVLDIHGNPIAYKSKGVTVQNNSFYRRLVKDGDLVEIKKKVGE